MANVEQQAALIIRDVVSWDDYAAAITHSTNETASKWASARLSVSLQETIGDELSKAAIREAVSQLYNVAASTIRSRERAAVVPEAIVDQYPGVSFSHWRTAVDYKGTNGMYDGNPVAAALDIMYQMEEYKEQYGKLPSVAVVDGWVYGDEETTRFPWQLRTGGILDQMDKVRYDEQTPIKFKILLGWVYGIIEKFLSTGESVLDDKTKGGDLMR